MKILIKIMYVMIFAVIASTSVSCTSMYYMKKNSRLTDKMKTSLFEKNGNAFCLHSKELIGSVVWTYDNDNGKINIYEIHRGRLRHSIKYDSSVLDPNKISGNESVEILPCIGCDDPEYSIMVGVLNYWVKRGTEVEVNAFPLVINRFTERKYESEFLNKIAEDIETYGIWKNFYKH